MVQEGVWVICVLGINGTYSRKYYIGWTVVDCAGLAIKGLVIRSELELAEEEFPGPGLRGNHCLDGVI